jgi:hypothetical protein
MIEKIYTHGPKGRYLSLLGVNFRVRDQFVTFGWGHNKGIRWTWPQLNRLGCGTNLSMGRIYFYWGAY